jgi:hypothetical protein
MLMERRHNRAAMTNNLKLVRWSVKKYVSLSAIKINTHRQIPINIFNQALGINNISQAYFPTHSNIGLNISMNINTHINAKSN